jgi:two-component system response regulator HydG
MSPGATISPPNRGSTADTDHFPATLTQMGAIFDYLATGFLYLSRENRILAINRTAESLTGLGRHAALGRLCHEALGESLCKDGGLSAEALRQARPLTGNLRVRDAEGELHHLLKIVAPVHTPDGALVGCMEIFQDITVFQEMMERVGQEGRRLRKILDHLDIGIFACDRGGHISFFNTSAERITGYLRREVLGKPCSDLFPEEFCRLAPRGGPQADTAAQDREIHLRASDGRQVPVRARTLDLGGQGTATLTTFSDLSLVDRYRRELQERYTFQDMVSADPAMHKLFEILPAVAASDATVLIEGPTGTGKDLLAKVIHNASPRAKRPLIKVNCAALPDNLLESELFGYVKGAFTGADRDKPGRFQDAHGGTLFLDEIGDLPLALQAKLLRVLEDHEFYPLGSRRPVKVDVRILSATNRELARQVAEGRFRQDLFYRLNVLRLELPPLRARRGDLPLLIEHVLQRLCADKNRRIEGIAEDALAILLNHDYPGNVRELENILEHALIICPEQTIAARHLPLALQAGNAPVCAPEAPRPEVPPPPQTDEKQRIVEALARHGGNRRQTAHSLGMDRTTLWRKMKRYGIER